MVELQKPLGLFISAHLPHAKPVPGFAGNALMMEGRNSVSVICNSTAAGFNGKQTQSGKQDCRQHKDSQERGALCGHGNKSPGSGLNSA